MQQQQIVVNRQASMTGYISPLGSPQPIMSPNANPMQQMPQQQQQQQLQRRQQTDHRLQVRIKKTNSKNVIQKPLN